MFPLTIVVVWSYGFILKRKINPEQVHTVNAQLRYQANQLQLISQSVGVESRRNLTARLDELKLHALN